MVQVHVLARVWGFESLLRHQIAAAITLRPLKITEKLLLNKSLANYSVVSIRRDERNAVHTEFV